MHVTPLARSLLAKNATMHVSVFILFTNCTILLFKNDQQCSFIANFMSAPQTWSYFAFLFLHVLSCWMINDLRPIFAVLNSYSACSPFLLAAIHLNIKTKQRSTSLHIVWRCQVILHTYWSPLYRGIIIRAHLWLGKLIKQVILCSYYLRSWFTLNASFQRAMKEKVLLLNSKAIAYMPEVS